MTFDPPEPIRKILARLPIDTPVYGMRSFSDGRIEFYCYGGRTVIWPDDALDEVSATEEAGPPDTQFQILAALGDGPLHKLSVTKLRHLAHLAGLHPSPRLKSIPKSQLVREMSDYRARRKEQTWTP